MKYPIIIISFFILSAAVFAQDSEPVFYWEMENSAEIETIVVPFDTTLVFEQGYRDLALSLNGNTHSLDLTKHLNFYEPFTLSFWFQPSNTAQEQTVFRQNRKLKNAASAKRFLEFYIKENRALLKTEKADSKLAELKDLKTSDGWMWLTFVGDRYGFRLFLQGEPVFESMDGTMFRQMGNYLDDLILGKGSTGFLGKIDEVKIFHEALEDETIRQQFEDFEENYLKQSLAQTGEDLDTVAIEAEPPFVLNDKLKKRKNKKPEETVFTKSKTITLEIWDYYKKIDGDKISIYLNNEEYSFRNNLVLDKKKNRIKIRIPLAEQEDNFILFFAENTGDYYSAATIAAYIEGMEDPVHLISNREENAVIKVVNKNFKKKKNATIRLPEIVAEKGNLTIELSPLSNEDKYDRLSLEYAADAQFYNIQLLDEARKINLDLAPEMAKHFMLKAVRLGENETCGVKLRVLENGKEKMNRVLYPHKENYELSLRRKAQIAKVENGKRSIQIPKTTVPVTSITLEILDHDQPDGDQIKLLYDGAVILDNYKLSEKPFQKVIRLNPDLSLHQFTILSQDFGSSLEPINTPRVRVLANGKKIDDFVLWLRKGKEVAVIEVLIK